MRSSDSRRNMDGEEAAANATDAEAGNAVEGEGNATEAVSENTTAAE